MCCVESTRHRPRKRHYCPKKAQNDRYFSSDPLMTPPPPPLKTANDVPTKNNENLTKKTTNAHQIPPNPSKSPQNSPKPILSILWCTKTHETPLTKPRNITDSPLYLVVLMPFCFSFFQVAVQFADLHDTPGRMEARGAVRKVVPWAESRSFFFWRLRRRLAEFDLRKQVQYKYI